MICCTSCSISSARAAVAAALLLGCASAPRAAPPRAPIAVLPPVNLTGSAIPAQQIRASLEAALRRRGIAIVEPAATEAFLRKYRVRNTSGVDREVARAAAEELSVDAVLVTSIEQYQPEPPPALAVTARLVTAGRDPAIAWIDGDARAGDESPGLFDLGVVSDPVELQARIFGRLAASLRAFREGKGTRAGACDSAPRYGPRTSFRAPSFDPAATRSVAVLPFLNETGRRDAGEVLALQIVRQLESTGAFRVIEPGLVRDEMLRYRLVMERGVSLDGARVVTQLLGSDLVVSGVVRDFSEAGVPRLGFTVVVLDRIDNEVVWMSSSSNRGDDGVIFFDAGRVGTAAALACKMTRPIVERLAEPR